MRRVVVFARRPVAGRVKTRLSPALPARLACDLHRAMLADALRAAAACGADETCLYWAPEEADETAAGSAPDVAPEVHLPPGVVERAQRGSDLGARLAAAFEELLPAHARPGDAPASASRAVVIGADCPALGADTLRRALHELEAHDVVLGPTRDGGYHLIGLRAPCRALFEGVAWSTERVLADTLARAAGAGRHVVLVETLDDLDTPADLTRLLAAAAHGAAIGVETGAALSALGLLPERPGVRPRGD